jgi:hypothetical protein
MSFSINNIIWSSVCQPRVPPWHAIGTPILARRNSHATGAGCSGAVEETIDSPRCVDRFCRTDNEILLRSPVSPLNLLLTVVCICTTYYFLTEWICVLWGKDKVVPLLNQLSTTPWKCMGEWMYRSTYSWPRYWLEASGQLHTPAALPPEKNPPVPIG